MTDLPWRTQYIFSLDGIPVIERLKANWMALRDEYFSQRPKTVPYPLDIYKGHWLVTTLRSNAVELGYMEAEHRLRVVEQIRGEGSACGMSNAELDVVFHEICEQETAANRARHQLLTQILDPLYPMHCRMYNYSLMEPGVRLRPHTGLDTSSVRVHLCLQEDAQCWLNVMGQTRTWKEGKVFAFR